VVEAWPECDAGDERAPVARIAPDPATGTAGTGTAAAAAAAEPDPNENNDARLISRVLCFHCAQSRLCDVCVGVCGVEASRQTGSRAEQLVAHTEAGRRTDGMSRRRTPWRCGVQLFALANWLPNPKKASTARLHGTAEGTQRPKEALFGSGAQRQRGGGRWREGGNGCAGWARVQGCISSAGLHPCSPAQSVCRGGSAGGACVHTRLALKELH
jgi:hypothetical protein